MADEATQAPAEDVQAETVATETPAVVEGEKALGDAGKQALDRMKQERNAAKADAKAQADALAEVRAELEKLKGTEDAGAKAIREAEERLTTQANGRVLRAELKAAATGKLADPADALRFLDLSEFKVDADGNVDAEAISKALTDLIEGKPYLAAQGRKFQGSGDGGARPSEPKRAQSLEEAIAARYEKMA